MILSKAQVVHFAVTRQFPLPFLSRIAGTDGRHRLVQNCSLCGNPFYSFLLDLTSRVAGTGLWKVSSVEMDDHPGCIGGPMRPSSEALLDVAGVMRVNTSVPAARLQTQLQEQVRLAFSVPAFVAYIAQEQVWLLRYSSTRNCPQCYGWFVVLKR